MKTHTRMQRMAAMLGMALVVASCGGGDAEPAAAPGDSYEPELLASHISALPNLEILRAGSVLAANVADGTAQAALLGDTATYPLAMHPVVTGINQAVAGIVLTLETITAIPPTLYDSDKREFLWGPWPNEDSAMEDDYVMVWIRDESDSPDADFHYVYAMVRGIGTDLANLTPVMWGGASPDPANDDYGFGATLWDFEANRAFEESHGTGTDGLDEGRFAAVYARAPSEDDPGAEHTVVIAAFRDFVPSDKPGSSPADLDYLYGHVVGPEWTVDFVDLALHGDVHQPVGATEVKEEDLQIWAAFVNGGFGRAEVIMAGGDVADMAADHVRVLECWDAAVAQTYWNVTHVGLEGTETDFETEGTPDGCGAPFGQSLSDLNVPSLATVDAQLLADLDEVASEGIPTQ